MKSVPCPTCGQEVEWSEASEWRPFCSERCRLIDLGEWFNESHRLPGGPGDEADQENIDPTSYNA